MIVAGGPVIPTFGTGSVPRGGSNGWFCTDWVRQHWSDTLQPALVQHVELAAIAVGIGFVIAFALALVGFRFRLVDPPIGIVSDFLYTIPSLAFLPSSSRSPASRSSPSRSALVSYTLPSSSTET